MKNEQEQNNIAKVAGIVFTEPRMAFEKDGERFYELILEVKRLSDQRDYLPITISERILDVSNKIHRGDEVGFLGEFRSYNKQENDRSKLILNVFAKEVFLGDLVEELGESNFVELTGFVCKTPVYRTTPFNREICDVLLAVNRKNFKSDYIPCIFWGRNARFMENQSVGCKVNIKGRIQSRIYLKKLPDGTSQERTAYEISVSELKICDIDDQSSAKTDDYKEYFQQNATEYDNAPKYNIGNVIEK